MALFLVSVILLGHRRVRHVLSLSSKVSLELEGYRSHKKTFTNQDTETHRLNSFIWKILDDLLFSLWIDCNSHARAKNVLEM